MQCFWFPCLSLTWCSHPEKCDSKALSCYIISRMTYSIMKQCPKNGLAMTWTLRWKDQTSHTAVSFRHLCGWVLPHKSNQGLRMKVCWDLRLKAQCHMMTKCKIYNILPQGGLGFEKPKNMTTQSWVEESAKHFYISSPTPNPAMHRDLKAL